MSLEALRQRIKDNKMQGVYLFYGNEEYTKDFYTHELRKAVKKSPLPEFNHIIFDASVSDPSSLAEAAFSLPYMWDFKLIEVRGLEPSSLTADQAEEYAEVINDLPEYIILLFLFRSGELDEGGRGKGIRALFDSIKNAGLVINFENESGVRLEKWILKHFSSRNIKTDTAVAQTLIALCGNDMYTLHGEIEKLCSSPAQSPITKDDVLKYCCPNESYKVYEISDALLRGDMNKVKRALDNLAAVKTEPSMLLGYLSRIYSDMLIVQAGLEESKGYGQIARLVGKPDWMVRRIASGLSGKPAGYITFACEAIDIADRKMKRYGINPYLVLEILLIRIGLYGYAK